MTGPPLPARVLAGTIWWSENWGHAVVERFEGVRKMEVVVWFPRDDEVWRFSTLTLRRAIRAGSLVPACGLSGR